MNFIKMMALFWIVACFESNGMLTTAIQKNFNDTCRSIWGKSLFIGATQNGFSNKHIALLHSQQFFRPYSFTFFKKESTFDKVDRALNDISNIGLKVANGIFLVSMESLVVAGASLATCSILRLSKEILCEQNCSKDEQN